MIYIVSVSGGLSSAEALRRTIASYGKENVIAVFCDVKGHARTHFWSDLPIVDQFLHERFGGEARDTYRFIWELAHLFDIPIERLEDGRTVFATYAKNRAFKMGNPGSKKFYAGCSKELKREIFFDYVTKNFKSGSYEIILGMDWDEDHRTKDAQRYYRHILGWNVNVTSPLADKPYVDKANIIQWLESDGITVPSAYRDNFDHNNCNGFCVMAGLSHWANLYFKRREVYDYAMWQEQRLQQYGINATILRSQRKDDRPQLSLVDFEQRILQGDYPHYDHAGCGCFVDGMAELVCQVPIIPKKKTLLFR